MNITVIASRSERDRPMVRIGPNIVLQDGNSTLHIVNNSYLFTEIKYIQYNKIGIRLAFQNRIVPNTELQGDGSNHWQKHTVVVYTGRFSPSDIIGHYTELVLVGLWQSYLLVNVSIGRYRTQ